MVSAIGLIAARLAPAYVDYRTINTLIEALPADKVHLMSKGEIYDALHKRFLINNIRDLDVDEDPDDRSKTRRHRAGARL